jgi:hypothetical protein
MCVETLLGGYGCNPDASEIPPIGIRMRFPTFANAEKLLVAEALS